MVRRRAGCGRCLAARLPPPLAACVCEDLCVRRITEPFSQPANNRDECAFGVTEEQVVNNTKTDVCSSTCRGRHTQVKGLATC